MKFAVIRIPEYVPLSLIDDILRQNYPIKRAFNKSSQLNEESGKEPESECFKNIYRNCRKIELLYCKKIETL